MRLPSVILLCLECEIRLRGLSAGHGNFCSLRSVFFLPGGYGVRPGRHILDGEVAVIIRDRVRTLHDDMPPVHPGMDVALYRNGDFRVLPTGLDGRSTRRLRLVPADIARAGRRQWVNVVRGLVAGGDLELLICIHGYYMRRVHAALLIEGWLLRGDGASCTGGQTLREIKNHVLQASIGAHYDVLQFGRTVLVLCDAIGILRHVNALHVRGCSVEFDCSGYGAFASGLDSLAHDCY